MGPKSNKFESSFQKKNYSRKKEESILKMEFPSLNGVIKKEDKSTKSSDTSSYKNMITIEECKKEVKEDKIGWIVLREKEKDSEEKGLVTDPLLMQENILEQVVRTQEMMDITHKKYKMRYIELYGEDEYNRNYMMTDSHLYDSSDEEELDIREESDDEL